MLPVTARTGAGASWARAAAAAAALLPPSLRQPILQAGADEYGLVQLRELLEQPVEVSGRQHQ